MEISCIVLAGGKSLRLGHDKVLENIGNRSLLEQVVSRVSSIAGEIIVVTAEERNFPQLAGQANLKVISDIFPGKGSLGGLYTGLVNSGSFYNLVVACDMPFLNQSLLRYMIEIAGGFDFVLPRVGDQYEPLHAVYSRDCLAPIESLLRRDRRAIVELFDLVNVRYVEAEEIDRFDPQHLSFFNINTREDLALARKIAAGDRP